MKPRACITLAATLTALLAAPPGFAQTDAEAAREMARKAQDPLADIRALMTDNAISFDGGPEDDTTFSIQLQPVYSIPNDTRFNLIARAIVPIMGVEPGVVLPPLGPEPRPSDDSKWGLGDTFLQLYFSPRTDSPWKWGIGPQVSLNTRSSDRQAGAGNGVGLAGVVFGGVGNWALGGIAMQHWGEDDFELTTLQPIALYNFESIPGAYIGYNNTITYNRKSSSGQRWTVPLGLMAGRTLLLDNGDGLDLFLGAYNMVENPDNAPEWQIRWGISYLWN